MGVAARGTAMLGRAGSLVNKLSEPVRGVPAADEPGTVAVIVRSAEPPGATVRLVGETAKAVPVVAAVTARALVPVLLTVKACIFDWVHPTLPRSMELEENIAVATPL